MPGETASGNFRNFRAFLKGVEGGGRMGHRKAQRKKEAEWGLSWLSIPWALPGTG
jgi:hypothetical protein